MGTAVAIPAGLPVAYTGGLVLFNPPTAPGATPVRLIPVSVSAAFTGTATGNTPAWGFAKLIGAPLGTLTATFGLGAFSGMITSPGVAGTASGVAVVAGSATILNGTAGGSYAINALNYVCVLGAASLGTSTSLASATTRVETDAETNVMPGEILVLFSHNSITALASISWIEAAGGAAASNSY
jgi:hypothetical protein